MKIAIDIDGTLNDNIPYINKKVKIFAKREGLKLVYNSKAYDFCEKYGYSQEDDNKFWQEEIWNYASEIDEKKLDAALKSNMPDIKNVFGFDSDGDLIIDTGVAYLADQRLQAYVQSNGILSTKTASLDRKIETSKNTIKKLETQLADKEAQLKQKYGQMEATLNSLESQQDSITNFNRQQQNNR